MSALLPWQAGEPGKTWSISVSGAQPSALSSCPGHLAFGQLAGDKGSCGSYGKGRSCRGPRINRPRSGLLQRHLEKVRLQPQRQGHAGSIHRTGTQAAPEVSLISAPPAPSEKSETPGDGSALMKQWQDLPLSRRGLPGASVTSVRSRAP